MAVAIDAPAGTVIVLSLGEVNVRWPKLVDGNEFLWPHAYNSFKLGSFLMELVLSTYREII